MFVCEGREGEGDGSGVGGGMRTGKKGEEQGKNPLSIAGMLMHRLADHGHTNLLSESAAFLHGHL